MVRPETYNPFNPELDEEFPIIKILSRENRVGILEGVPEGWNHIFMNSPAQNAETEMLMGKFVIEAMRAGGWTDLPVRKDRVVGREVSVVDGKGTIYEVKSVFEKPQKILEEIGFVKRVLADDGSEVLKPTRKMVVFIKERLARYSKI